jgi:uncharacterized membrane protein YbaN (DUF454 family)
MKYWIRDEDNTPQGFPVNALFRCILERLSPPYRVWLLRSEGYGVTVNDWNKELDSVDRLPIQPNQLLVVSNGTEEWFYNLDVLVESSVGSLVFGLHDSTAMYVQGPEQLVESICSRFALVSLAASV